MRRAKQTEETKAKIRAAAFARYQWDDAKIQRIEAALRAGVALRAVAEREGVYRGTLARFCEERGITRRRAGEVTPESTAFLLAHYVTMADAAEMFRLYREARGGSATTDAMKQHAARLGLKRPRNFHGNRKKVHIQAQEKYRAERASLAPAVQKLLDDGLTLTEASRALKLSTKRTLAMCREGLLVRRVVGASGRKKDAAPKQPRHAKPPKVAKPIPARKPRKLPASWVRVEKAAPRPTFQSVEEWEAAGNVVTRCPAAVVAPSTYTPSPEDGAAIAAYHAAQERAFKPAGVNAWQAQRNAYFRRRAGA